MFTVGGESQRVPIAAAILFSRLIAGGVIHIVKFAVQHIGLFLSLDKAIESDKASAVVVEEKYIFAFKTAAGSMAGP
ncbi:hypothetical protein QEP77_15790 [Serratia sp. B1]|nr:hypothetical protein QEP77_15790 [Serratia sp. B1]